MASRVQLGILTLSLRGKLEVISSSVRVSIDALVLTEPINSGMVGNVVQRSRWRIRLVSVADSSGSAVIFDEEAVDLVMVRIIGRLDETGARGRRGENQMRTHLRHS